MSLKKCLITCEFGIQIQAEGLEELKKQENLRKKNPD